MEKLAETKICSICGYENDPFEMLCANPSCGGDLTQVTVSRVQPVAKIAVVEIVCENGHAMVEGDEICLECGGSPAREAGKEDEFPKIPGCVIDSGAEAEWQYFGAHETHGAVRIVVYPARYEPDALRQERLAALDAECDLRLFEHCQDYEIWERGQTVSDVEPEVLARRVSAALTQLHEAGMIFRDLRLETLALRGDALVLGDFSQAVPSDFGVSLAPTEGRLYFLAPEAAVGTFREASDWWSLGSLLLQILTKGKSTPDVHDRAYLMQLVTRGIEVPSEGIDPMWQHLLKGLLTRDPEKRWSGDETIRWLDGERGIPVFYENDDRRHQNKPLRLGGVDYHAVADWTLNAAAAANWDAAAEQLAGGALGTWLAGMDESPLAELNRIRADEEINVDERLALVLVLLNAHQPISFRGELVNGQWLLAHGELALSWLEGRWIAKLHRIGRATWLVELQARMERAQALVRELGIRVSTDDFRAASLVADAHVLMQRWRRRRRDFPACEHRGLASIGEKSAPSAEELLVLVSATLDQFTPALRILREAAEEAGRAESGWDEVAAQEWFRHSRRDIFRELNARLNGFVRCGDERLDEWADTFRLDRRLTLARALVLLGVDESAWQPPPKQEYLRQLFDFFYLKILRGVQRGPLLALRVSANSRNIDVVELGDESLPPERILNHILGRIEKPLTIPPGALIANPLLERRMRRLSNLAMEYERDTGIRALYLGFPTLFLRPASSSESAKPKRAPLFLWSVNLRASAGFRGRVQLQHDRERGGEYEAGGIELNPALQTLLQSQDVERLQDMLNEAAARTNLDAKAFFDLCATALPDVLSDEYEMCLLPRESPEVPFGNGRLMACGALFLCDFSQQTIAQDIRQLSGRPLHGGALMQTLRLEDAAEPEALAAPVKESEKFTILPADPSQQRAILASRRESGLVIQGPPGTGKSQTIANIIADCLGRGERVLVVCQKQAALDVVARRLAEEGLDNRFFMVLDARRGREPLVRALRDQTNADAAWRRDSRQTDREEISDSIERLERDLTAYSNALQQEVEPSGLTYAQIVDRLIAVRERPRIAAYGLRTLLINLSREQVRRVTDQTAPLCQLWREAEFHQSPWHPLREIAYDEGSIAAFKKVFLRFLKAEVQRNTHFKDSGRIFYVENPEEMALWVRKNRSVSRLLNDLAVGDAWRWQSLFPNKAESLTADATQLANEAESIGRGQMHHDLHHFLTALTPSEFLQLGIDAGKVIKGRTSLLAMVLSVLAKLRVRKFLQVAGLGDEAIDSLDAQLKIEQSRRHFLRRWHAIADRLNLDVGNRDVEVRELGMRVRDIAVRLVRAKIGAEALLSCPQDSEFGAALGKKKAQALVDFFESADVSLKYVADCWQAKEIIVELEPWFCAEWLDKKKEAINSAKESLSELRRMAGAIKSLVPFLKFRPRYQRLEQSEQKVFEALSEVDTNVEDWDTVFRNTLENEALLGWKGVAETADPALQMGREEFESKVEALYEVSDSLREANRQLLKRPWKSELIANATSWLEILKLRGANARRLREVLDVGWDLGLFNLRPVWLTSPETVARIFPLREGMFDLVIFDEASQMPVELAIPALYRAKRVVVSGDRKQLPPTTFFSMGVDDCGDDDEDDHLLDAGALFDQNVDDATRTRLEEKAQRREIKDCEDLLQLLDSVMPNTLLTIHYRSQWRHLIEHSNAAFYDRRLSIPALNPDARVLEHRPLDVRRIDGLYADQVNEDEALAVVAFLAEHWLQKDPPSVGVVTFNMKQAELIEELLETRMEVDSEFRSQYEVERSRAGFDAFFVKNLENVQGDERDWMIFSTTFGTNEKGKFIRNFGPLGQRNGERRLNVATTRAREKMVIFSSMPTAEIAELLAGEGTGPRDYLKSYLSYAEFVSSGDLKSAEGVLNRLTKADVFDRNVFEKRGEKRAFVLEVEAFLRGEGFAPEHGASNDAFHFDLALVDGASGRFGLAIECDPPVHDDLDSAFAREIWRPAILGASIPARLRMWSRLWLENPDEEKKRLLDAAAKFR